MWLRTGYSEMNPPIHPGSIFDLDPLTRVGMIPMIEDRTAYPSGPPAAPLPMSKLLLVLENRTYREALFQALGRSGRFNAVVSVGSALEALHKQHEIQAETVLLGLTGDSGIPAVRALRMVAPDVTVVVLGISDTDPEALDWAEAGTLAFVPATASLQELLDCLDLALRGESHHSGTYTASLIRRMRSVARLAPPVERDLTRLTSREREIVVLIDQGCSNKDIARRLGIEVATVKNHVHNILEKVHARRRSEAAALVAGRVV
jgi:two-component system nitrate/nitrite response regulator NarL